MAALRVVVAEDDAPIRELVTHHLTRDGFMTFEASDGPTALRYARDRADLVVLDIGLPGLDGLDIARVLRREGRTTPLIMLTARTDEVDRVVGLELGADDYVTKPFSPRELVARVRAVLRRSGAKHDPGPYILRFGRLEIDDVGREVRVDGVDIGMKPREFALLRVFADNAGVAMAREALLEKVWGYDYDGDERTVDVHVRRLRLRLEREYGLPACLLTIHGHGYKFVPPTD